MSCRLQSGLGEDEVDFSASHRGYISPRGAKNKYPCRSFRPAFTQAAVLWVSNPVSTSSTLRAVCICRRRQARRRRDYVSRTASGEVVIAESVRLTAVLSALATLCAAFTALFADKATAKNCQTRAQAATVLLLLHDDSLGRTLVLHLAAGRRITVALRRVALRWRTAIGLRRGGRAAIVALVGHGDATKGVERWTKGRWWRR